MRIHIPFMSVATALLLAACSSGNQNDVSNLSPTWSNVYSAVLAKQCLPCHASATGLSQGHLDMASKGAAYTHLVGVAASGAACGGKGTLVVPGQASSSLLYEKLSTSPPCGSMMPFGRAPLSGSEKNLIKNWINRGAMND
jgi:hypothetical protein